MSSEPDRLAQVQRLQALVQHHHDRGDRMHEALLGALDVVRDLHVQLGAAGIALLIPSLRSPDEAERAEAVSMARGICDLLVHEAMAHRLASRLADRAVAAESALSAARLALPELQRLAARGSDEARVAVGKMAEALAE